MAHEGKNSGLRRPCNKDASTLDVRSRRKTLPNKDQNNITRTRPDAVLLRSEFVVQFIDRELERAVSREGTCCCKLAAKGRERIPVGTESVN